jgi:hypothetical protein
VSNLVRALGFSISSLADFESTATAEAVVRRLFDVPALLRPNRFGEYEPADRPAATEQVMEQWLYQVGQRRADQPGLGNLIFDSSSGVRYQVGWHKAVEPRFSFIGGEIPLTLAAQPEALHSFLRLVRELAVIVDAVYGEVRNLSFPGWDLPFDLWKRLPDVAWATILGGPYVSMFGQTRVLSTPCSRVERLGPNHFWLEATNSPFEPVPEDVRSMIRAHLGEESFMSGGRWRYSSGVAPLFDVSAVTLRREGD